MDAKIQFFLLASSIIVGVAYAGECCKSYTDILGTYHSALVCPDYCCWKLDLSLKTRTCCSDVYKRVPEELRDDCESWIKDHIWLPIVASIAFLVTIVLICTCCCCGCCACCRSSQPRVILTQVPAGQSRLKKKTSGWRTNLAAIRGIGKSSGCFRVRATGLTATCVPSVLAETVVMSSQQQQQTYNPAHYGYNQ